jgi:electron transport complex protein RnfC
MSMHIGKPAKPVVKRGDLVKVGQLIGEADGFFSVSVHSSVSGKVLRLDEETMSNGARVQTVVIESDGLQEKLETLAPPSVSDFESFVGAVKKSGVVGLGGAGFPSFIKLGVKELAKIEDVVINAAECEPYITSDTRTMIEKTEYIFKGIEAIRKYMGVKHFVIGIENNKREAIDKLTAAAEGVEGVELKVLPAVYPQGGEKVLVYNCVGRMIPRGELPIDVGVIVINVTTLAFIAEYLESGVPLVSKCVTVDGSAIESPKNLMVPLGTPISDLLDFCGLKAEPAKILYGGPMMGITVPSASAPVLKQTNAIVVMDEKEAKPPKTTPCINCGRCLNNCPLKLDPRAIARSYKLGDAEALDKLCADICMECGCCSFVCPAKRPLVQTNKLAKAMLREYISTKEEKK